MSYLGKSRCELSDFVLQSYYQGTGCLRPNKIVDVKGPCKQGLLLKEGCSYSPKFYTGAAFKGEQCSGPSTRDRGLCVCHFLLESVQQYVMFISLQSVGIFFSIDFTQLVLRRIHTVASHLDALATTSVVFFWNPNMKSSILSDIFPTALHVCSAPSTHLTDAAFSASVDFSRPLLFTLAL